MTKLRHWDGLNTVRFVTFSCYQRLPLLSEKGAAQIVLDELERARKKHQFLLHAFVLMPEHLHLVLYPAEGTQLGLLVRELKSRSARRIFTSTDILSSFPQLRIAPQEKFFWLSRCYDHNCRAGESVLEKIKYCHLNPVKRRLVAEPEDWAWSSYGWYVGRKCPIRIDTFEK